MSIVYTLDTTANAPVEGIPLKKLGIRNNIVHPTIGFNLTDLGLTPTEIQNSEELSDALKPANNWIILYANGVSVASPDIQPTASLPSLNSIDGTLAINKGGTGQTTALAGFNALSPLITKGDLLSRDGTNNIRVPVGANNRYLVADSAQTSGLDWKALDVDSQNIVGGAPTAVLDLTNAHPNTGSLTYYNLAFTGANYTLTTAGRNTKNYLVTFEAVYGINSAADRYTYFRFLVDGVAQTAYDFVCFTTDTYRPTQASKSFTLNNIAPGTVIRVVYGIATNLGINSPGSTTIRNFGTNLSIYGVG